MTVPTSKGLARDGVLKPGETVLSDADGLPFTPENHGAHDSGDAPTGVDTSRKVHSGASLDIDSAEMPEDGVVEVHDSDADLLDVERETPIAADARPVR